MRRIPALATAAVLALTLAACSSPADSTSSASDEPATTSSQQPDSAASAPAETGEAITGDGYSYSVPEGWGVPEGTEKPAGVDTFAADLASTGTFASNVNVVLSPAGEVSLDQAESAGPGELETVGATDVQVLERTSIDGVEAAHLSATVTGSYLFDQYYASSNGQTYIVTFSVPDGTSEGDRTALADSILGSWQWS
jgi:hypothetical protein